MTHEVDIDVTGLDLYVPPEKCVYVKCLYCSVDFVCVSHLVYNVSFVLYEEKACDVLSELAYCTLIG